MIAENELPLKGPASKILRTFYTSCMAENHTSLSSITTISNKSSISYSNFLIIFKITVKRMAATLLSQKSVSGELNSTILTDLIGRAIQMGAAPFFDVNYRKDTRSSSQIIVIRLPHRSPIVTPEAWDAMKEEFQSEYWLEVFDGFKNWSKLLHEAEAEFNVIYRITVEKLQDLISIVRKKLF